MDDTERAAASKIIETFKDAPELKIDSSQFKPDEQFEMELPEKENPKET